MPKYVNWSVYIVKCSDESLYTGISNDLDKRISKHNSKKGAKYVRGKLPVVLVYKEEFENQIDAAIREREIKGWTRIKKLELINSKQMGKS